MMTDSLPKQSIPIRPGKIGSVGGNDRLGYLRTLQNPARTIKQER